MQPALRRCLVLAILLLSAGPVSARPVLAVMAIQDQTRGLSTSVVDSLTESLRSVLARSGRFIVIDKTRQAAELRKLVIKQKKESYSACYGGESRASPSDRGEAAGRVGAAGRGADRNRASGCDARARCPGR